MSALRLIIIIVTALAVPACESSQSRRDLVIYPKRSADLTSVTRKTDAIILAILGKYSIIRIYQNSNPILGEGKVVEIKEGAVFRWVSKFPDRVGVVVVSSSPDFKKTIHLALKREFGAAAEPILRYSPGAGDLLIAPQ